MKLYIGIFILALFLSACGKKFMDPKGNQFLAAEVTASPLTIASDSLVTITGQGFSTDPNQDQVFFNGTGAAVLQASATRLVVKAPAAGSTGNITVRVNGEQANGPVFTYPSSSVFSMSPLSGVDSTTVTLATAIRVGPTASTTVLFGNLPGKVLYTDSSRIIVSAPHGVQTGQLSIQTNGQQYAGPVFTLITVQAVSPNIQGSGGGTVQIIGTGFNPVPNRNAVTFTQKFTGNPVPATVVGGSVDTLTVQLPAGVGTGPVTVNPNNQNVVTGPIFTLFSIDSRSSQPYSFPFIATSGIPQLLIGSGFNPDVSQNHLTVNGLPCTVTYVSPTGDSILYYLPDLINPPQIGLANGPLVLQSGSLTATTAGLQNIAYEEVTTLAGGSYGLANGKGKNAQFETLAGITYGHPLGAAAYNSPAYFYVVDREANNVRRITTDGIVTLVAGSPTGQAGYADGIGASALFNAPSGVVIDNNGYLWVADSGNFRVRVIDPKTYQVTTVAGTGVPGTADGVGVSAQFLGPTGVSLYGSNCYSCGLTASVVITDAAGGTGSLRQVVRLSDGSVTVTTLQSGLINPRSPYGGYSQVAYVDNEAVYYYNAGGFLAGTPGSAGFMNGPSGALFNNPLGLVAMSPPIPGTFWMVGDAGNNVIRVIYNNTYTTGTGPYPVYTYIGGMGGTTAGYQDGGFRTALFNKPGAMITVPNSYKTFLYVCDVGNHAIRIIN
ncbi:MAG: IPT/TIG domain-containing protein [Chitinophagaceae bacterium]|nr:IPT/TIG domain-containing protein [Chitinophagaceae bacterium]